jgi:hypothetical protein
MIIVRMLYNCRAEKRAEAQSFMRPVIHLLLESAAVCCACLVITLVTFLLNNNGGAFFMVAVTPMIVVRALRFDLRHICEFVTGLELLGDHHPCRARHRGARQRWLVVLARCVGYDHLLTVYASAPQARERASDVRRSGALSQWRGKRT